MGLPLYQTVISVQSILVLHIIFFVLAVSRFKREISVSSSSQRLLSALIKMSIMMFSLFSQTSLAKTTTTTTTATTTTTTTITTTTKMSFTSIMSLFYNSFTGFWCQFSGGIPLRHFLSEFWRWEVSNPSIWSRLWCDRTIWIWNRRLNLQFVHIFQSLFLRGRDLACHLIMFWPKQSCALLDKSQVRSPDKAVKSTSKWCQR